MSNLVELDIDGIRKFIVDSGLKQKTIAEKAGLGEVKFCLVLQKKRRLEVSEYADLCIAMGVPIGRFLKIKKTDKTKS